MEKWTKNTEKLWGWILVDTVHKINKTLALLYITINMPEIMFYKKVLFCYLFTLVYTCTRLQVSKRMKRGHALKKKLPELLPWNILMVFSNSPTHIIKTEYYVSMLIRRFVSLRVACVKSYHARPKVERDATLHRQREVIQTDGSIC